MTGILLTAAALIGYLLGSLNTAIIVSRLLKGDDIRRHGSGNAGMTNMLRTYGKGCAALTVIGDFLKPAVAILLSRWAVAYFGVYLPVDIGYIAGIGAMLGHLFPVYFRFKGGKGAVTALGVMCLVNPPAFAIIALVFIPMIFITRIVSLSSLLGAFFYPFITWGVLFFQGRPILYDSLMAAVIGVLIIVMHKDNIKRLLNGTENRFGSKKQSEQEK